MRGWLLFNACTQAVVLQLLCRACMTAHVSLLKVLHGWD